MDAHEKSLGWHDEKMPIMRLNSNIFAVVAHKRLRVLPLTAYMLDKKRKNFYQGQMRL